MRGSGDAGVILFSFGSYVRGMKTNQAETLLAAFSRLKQRVVMKYKDEESLTPPKNTLVLKWLPQNDILGQSAHIRGVSCEAFGGLGPRVTKGAPKKKKKERKEKKERNNERKEKRKKKINQHDESGAIEAQAGALGKKTSGAPN